MEKLEKIQMLNTFLHKVKQLRGYGDMSSYALAKEFEPLAKLSPENPETKSTEDIIADFNSVQNWNNAKNNLIQNVEAVIEKIK